MQPELSINEMCKAMGTSKQANYGKDNYKSRKIDNTDIIIEKVKYIREKLPVTGGKKLKYMVARRMVDVGRDRLFAILRSHNLLLL